MPKPYTFPQIIDEFKSISVTDLKKLGYFVMNKSVKGNVNWTNNGNITSSITVEVFMSEYSDVFFARFIYTCNGTKYNYKVGLELIQSNLGKGKVIYFVCPFTKRRCRKLHLIDEKFIHRSALINGMYETQTYPKKWRSLKGSFDSCFVLEECYLEIYSKHFKTHYNGKPTKRYLNLLKKIQYAESMPIFELEKMLVR